ncbi:sensor histidine kinase [Massilia consociata]|uniref:histidine kinase n=1 Tax=Massilia consociata TaxID=760117 RepID=A0ABV6FJ43_9BURK
MKAHHGLRRRMVLAFSCFSLLTALCFSAFCLVFVYVVEDRFFTRMLAEEAAHQQRHWSRTGRPASTLRPATTLHADASSFPPDLARQGPARSGEFFGDAGRHYHVLALDLAGEGRPRYLVMETSRELVVRAQLPLILAVLAALALAVLLVTLGAGYWLARRATAPLSRLTGLVAQARPGELPRGFAAGFPDNEIGVLATALDQAMARIAAFLEREQNFTRDASHELRTPLAVIDGAAFLLAQQSLPGPAREQVERIRTASAHMEQAVRTLLALAREEEGRDWPAAAFAVLPLVEDTVVRHAHLATGEVEVRVPAQTQALCHPEALAILLDNLVGNAFHHGGEGRIRILVEDGWLVIEDSGPGLDPAVRARLGAPGVRRSGSAGFGLGLSITRRVAERAGIAIRVDNGAHGGVRAALRLDALPIVTTWPAAPC